MVAGAALLWGLWPLFIHGSGVSGPAAALMTMVAMAVPAPFVLRREAFADRGAVVALLLVGVFDAINAALYFTAVERGPVVVAVLTHYLAPLVVALLAPLVLREKLSGRVLVAIPVVLGGLALVLSPTSADVAWTTAAYGGSSALMYGSVVVASKRAAASFTALEVTALHAPISVVVLLAVFGGGAVPPTVDAGFWRMVVGAFVAGLGGGLVFNEGLRRVPSSLAGVLTYLEPVVAALVGVMVFGEPFGLQRLAGVVVVLGTGAWVARRAT